ncbi:Gfo/Idh/MocA family protein [Agromyces sp. NPDC056965]|uniref:Gfo/Idh/MocA family protein n=1 Tax=Agromyces sp. NPDC056965 TaxID=3345983 RepID=UPI00362D491B
MDTPTPSARLPLRVALVGAGGIAHDVHLPSIREIGDAEIVVETVVEIDPARGAEFAERWGIPNHTTELAKALDARPDLVILCTPPSLHRAQVMACLAAGISVWCEKPPALSLAEYDEMIAGERDGGPYAPIVFQQRFGSGAQHARHLLASGALGHPLIAHCQTTWYRGDDYFAAPWRGSFTGDGGPIMALGIHQIDLMLSLLGEWREVSATVNRLARDIETDDVAAAWVRLESGVIATIANSAVSPAQLSRVRVDTERATVELSHLYGYGNDDWVYTPAPGLPAEEVATWADELPDERSTHTPQLRRLISDLRASRRPETSGAGGRAALELVTALYKSALTGEIVRRGSITPGDPFYSSLNGGLALRSEARS